MLKIKKQERVLGRRVMGFSKRRTQKTKNFSGRAVEFQTKIGGSSKSPCGLGW